MAISSYCRECGEYFRIEKGEPVIKAGPRISGISDIKPHGIAAVTETESSDDSFEEEKEEDQETGATVDAWLRSPSAQRRSKAKPLTSASAESDSPDEKEGDGSFFGLMEDVKKQKEAEKKASPPKEKKKKKPKEPEKEPETETDNDENIGKEAQSVETLAEGSMSALIGDIADQNEFGADSKKMPANFVQPEQQAKRVGKKKASNERRVRCFRCNHVQMVTKYASSTQCGRCSVYITMGDYEIKGVRENVLRTRGNVTVARRGSLLNTNLACHDFTAYGAVSAKLDCTGKVVFKNSGKVSGRVYCEHLVIAKKCEVEFPDGVVANSAEIYGKVRGDVTCKDTITVYKTGVIAGNARADQVEIKGEGMVSGEISLERDIDTDLSIKAGFNPSIIN